MRITFLGTGTSQGIPVIGCDCKVCTSRDPRDNRLRTSVHVQHAGTSIVIDVGPDFRQQMLNNNIDELKAVLITHEHNDHIIGMDDIRPFNFRQKRSMDIYAERRVLGEIQMRFPYIFSGRKYPGMPEISLIEIDLDPFSVDQLQIEPIRIDHGNLPILGFRIGDFCYLTDANNIPDSEISKIKGVKILIINALRRRKHWSHFTLDEAISWIERLEAGQAYLTHISHLMGPTAEWEDLLPANIHPGYDGLQLDIDSLS